MRSSVSDDNIKAETFSNVFDALDVEMADEEMARCELAGHIFRIGREQNLTNVALAERAGCPPERIAQLHNADFGDVTIDELCRYLVALGHGIRIVVAPAPQSDAQLTVAD